MDFKNRFPQNDAEIEKREREVMLYNVCVAANGLFYNSL